MALRIAAAALAICACTSPAEERTLSQTLGSSYYATAVLQGKELRNSYVPEYWLGEGRYGADWVRVQQTDTDPVLYDAALRAAPGPGYVVRNPARPMRAVPFAQYPGGPVVKIFEDQVQFCGADGLIIVVDYSDVSTWREDPHIPTPRPSPAEGAWLVTLNVHTYGRGDPTCLGTPLPALPRK